MKLKSDKEFADELDARDRLRARGYTWKVCESCRGSGFKLPKNNFPGDCYKCGGRGGRWVAPITC